MVMELISASLLAKGGFFVVFLFSPFLADKPLFLIPE